MGNERRDATVNIACSVERGAAQHPHRLALRFEQRVWSYRALERQANRAANALRDRGVRPGDRVALQLPNIPAFVWAYLGILKLGAIVVSLNATLTTDETQALLRDAGARLLVTHRQDTFEG